MGGCSSCRDAGPGADPKRHEERGSDASEDHVAAQLTEHIRIQEVSQELS